VSFVVAMEWHLLILVVMSFIVGSRMQHSILAKSFHVVHLFLSIRELVNFHVGRIYF
jgi:hypothetical protein